MQRTPVLLILAAALVATIAPASAQFFDPPRPPGDVPGRAPARPPPPQPQSQPPSDPYAGPASPFQQPAPRGGVQSQPLPPPPGATAAPPPQPPVQQGTFAPPPAGPAAPGQAPPPGAPLQPGDEVVTTLPTAKIANPTAVFAGLDKITGRITTFDAAVNETVEFGALRVTPRACYTRPPTEPQNTDGFLEVDEITLQGETRRIFTGWMFAASPGLHGVEHPIYDVWLTDCKGGDPTTVAGAKPPEPEPPPAPAPQRRTPARKR
ncbi:MAG TPA: DUF2155 domain-containing protein [Xanthobacteraceae bacterium]|jgi:hypothetical protein|nr:DUF2155 domain-containing protein [Xanthobacteraceae bacterium]